MSCGDLSLWPLSCSGELCAHLWRPPPDYASKTTTGSRPPLPCGLPAIRSSLQHNRKNALLVFHVIAPQRLHPRLARLGQLFPDAAFTVSGLANTGVDAKVRSLLRVRRRRRRNPQTRTAATHRPVHTF